MTGGSAWSERSREPTLTTEGESCHQRILSRPPIWSRLQPNSLAREELGEKSILLRSVWRGFRGGLKRVRSAESRVDDNAEMPEPTSEPAPSNLPTEATSSSTAPTPSTEPALPPSPFEVPDQVMSEGASSCSDAAVRLSMKRSSDSSNSESETKRHHADHSKRDVVLLLDDSDVSHAVQQCREVCRRKGTFLVDVNALRLRWHDRCLLQQWSHQGTHVE